MRRIMVIFCLCCGLFPVHAAAEEAADDDRLRVVINGEVVAEVSARESAADGMPLVPLRAVCEYVGGAVRWNAPQRQAVIDHNGSRHTLDGVVRDGRLLVAPGPVAFIFNLQAWYEPSLSVVSFCRGLEAGGAPLTARSPRDDGYSREDAYWLARIVEAEARGEPYASRLAVANVVLNRLSVPQYPDTIKEVIFDKKHGVQFTPTINGAIHREPDAVSAAAARDALDGVNNAPGALFFVSPELATNFWVQKNRPFAYTIGGHAYYY